MPFCQHCGNEVEQLPGAMPVAEAVHVDLEIARINAERDVAIARLQARADREALETAETIAETEAVAQVETAAAVAEVLADDEPAPADDAPAPLVLDAPQLDDEPDDAPPPADDDHQPHEPRKPRGLGMW